MTPPPELDAETKARIEAEETYRRQVREQEANKKKKGLGCFPIGCGTIVVLLGLLLIMNQCASDRRPSSYSDSAPPSVTAAGRHYITDSGYVGCSDEKVFNQLVHYVAQGDKAAFARLLEASDCITLIKGEEVELEDVPPLSGQIKVRQPGSVKSYWTNSEAVH